ncbi:ATP-dependent zinc protease [Aestuariirhabdus sp. LZHN29]|uniref:ATP-dependent zinc protease family protein n=1 Tax=Aestuariirhabdus sp. LZHN29 TaxID=3417462 RepID=UPI003CF7D8CC
MRVTQALLFGCTLFLLAGCQTTSPMATSSVTPDKAETAPATASQPENTLPPAEEPATKSTVPSTAKQQNIGDMMVIGEVEKARITPGNFVTEARIDTGATTTSIHAWDTVEFERDGKRWVKFKTLGPDSKGSQTLERPVTRIASIKRHGAEDVKRFAVKVTVTIGKVSERIEVTLADRKAFDYKILVGRNLLADLFVVDVSKKNVAGSPAQPGK